MGSDDLHHKRKAKRAFELQRKEATKKPYDRVLIVCEGEKTEPLYFQDLIDEYKLSSANVKIEPSPDTCPSKLVEYSIQCNENDSYDRIFCVFDKDRHTKFNDALQKLDANEAIVSSAYSIPCFEYWILLHFEFTTASFYSHPTKSPGEEAVSRLKTYIHDYAKGKPAIFNLIKDSQEQAKNFATKANLQALKTGTDEPSTKIVELVTYLEKLRDLAAVEA